MLTNEDNFKYYGPIIMGSHMAVIEKIAYSTATSWTALKTIDGTT